MNLIHENKTSLQTLHYVRKASRRWWFDLPKSKIEEKVIETDGDFCIILYGTIDRPNDFYAIPYIRLRYLLTTDALAEASQTHGPRWVGDIESHCLSIRNCPEKLEVGAFYGNVGLLLRTIGTAKRNRS